MSTTYHDHEDESSHDDDYEYQDAQMLNQNGQVNDHLIPDERQEASIDDGMNNRNVSECHVNPIAADGIPIRTLLQMITRIPPEQCLNGVNRFYKLQVGDVSLNEQQIEQIKKFFSEQLSVPLQQQIVMQVKELTTRFTIVENVTIRNTTSSGRQLSTTPAAIRKRLERQRAKQRALAAALDNSALINLNNPANSNTVHLNNNNSCPSPRNGLIDHTVDEIASSNGSVGMQSDENRLHLHMLNSQHTISPNLPGGLIVSATGRILSSTPAAIRKRNERERARKRALLAALSNSSEAHEITPNQGKRHSKKNSFQNGIQSAAADSLHLIEQANRGGRFSQHNEYDNDNDELQGHNEQLNESFTHDEHEDSLQHEIRRKRQRTSSASTTSNNSHEESVEHLREVVTNHDAVNTAAAYAQVMALKQLYEIGEPEDKQRALQKLRALAGLE